MMATYFHGGSEIQATNPSDHLQTLYLMNPNFLSSYSDSSHNTNNNNNNNQSPTNMLLLNPSVGPNGLIPHAPPHQQQPCQQLIGIPLPGSHSENHSRPSSSTSLHPNREILPAGNNNNSSLHGLAVSRVHYNLWSPTVEPGQAQHGPIHPADVDGQMGFRRTGGAQGLSLSLSPNQQNPVAAVAVSGTAAVGSGGADDGRMSVTVAAGGSTVSNGVQGVILGSKYLKAAQELLDQVVHVGDFNKGGSGGGGGPHKEKAKSVAVTDDGGSGGGGGEGSSTGSKRPFDQLTTAQRQELQMKKAKLLNMLDEVEQRYRQYHTQMQVVVSSFEQAAGFGSAKLYTSLALQTISRQFRCLKDAITSQIKATSKSLGEEDKNGGGSGEGGVGSRLRFVDHQLRQQRALQQLGMMQHNAWRPQRGLPERAVSVLRAWLFEHFLHPYPKDSDKHMLAKQTGLTRSQVSNWFINARVRLWKPMVEEMYAEEMKSQEQLHNGGNIIEDNTNTNAKTNSNMTSTNNLDTTTNPSLNDHNKDQLSPTKTTITPHQPDGGAAIIHHSDHHTTTNDMISAMSTTSSQGFSLIGSSSDMESLMGRSPKKQRSGSDIQQNSPSSILSMDMDMKPSDNHHHHQHQDHGSGFNPYLVHEMGRFNPDPLTTHHHHYPNNGVSLTLGLPHCENNLSLGNHQQNFMSQGMNLGRRIDIGANEAEFCGISMGQPSHPNNNGYDTIDIQSRTRFAAQLLHDFVA